MAWTKLKTTVVAGAAALAISTPIIMQWNDISKLRQEQQLLRQQNRQFQEDSAAELDRLRAENKKLQDQGRDASEVHKLRNEVGGLRREKMSAAALRADNERLRRKLGELEKSQSAEEEKAEQEEEQQQMIAQMDNVKGWLLAFFEYAGKNQNQLPAGFDQAALYFPSEMTNIVDLERFEIIQHGPIDQIEKPERTVVIKEKEARPTRDGGMVHFYGFADGHVEVSRREVPESGVFP